MLAISARCYESALRSLTTAVLCVGEYVSIADAEEHLFPERFATQTVNGKRRIRPRMGEPMHVYQR